MEKFYGQRDQASKEEGYMGASNSFNWEKDNWCQMSLQVEEECKMRSREI